MATPVSNLSNWTPAQGQGPNDLTEPQLVSKCSSCRPAHCDRGIRNCVPSSRSSPRSSGSAVTQEDFARLRGYEVDGLGSDMTGMFAGGLSDQDLAVVFGRYEGKTLDQLLDADLTSDLINALDQADSSGTVFPMTLLLLHGESAVRNLVATTQFDEDSALSESIRKKVQVLTTSLVPFLTNPVPVEMTGSWPKPLNLERNRPGDIRRRPTYFDGPDPAWIRRGSWGDNRQFRMQYSIPSVFLGIDDGAFDARYMYADSEMIRELRQFSDSVGNLRANPDFLNRLQYASRSGAGSKWQMEMYGVFLQHGSTALRSLAKEREPAPQRANYAEYQATLDQMIARFESFATRPLDPQFASPWDKTAPLDFVPTPKDQ